MAPAGSGCRPSEKFFSFDPRSGGRPRRNVDDPNERTRMAGLNHVEPGADPLTLPLSDTVTLPKLSVGPMDNNAYLLRAGAASLLIDAAADADRLLAVTGPTLDTIVTTHRHRDHWQ